MNEKYLNYLIEQFKQATGIKNVDIDSQSFKTEFFDWIVDRQSMIGGYLNLLDYMQFDISDCNTAEVDKGCFDSIVNTLYVNTTIITPFSGGMNEVEKSRIITSDFRVLGGLPMLVATDDRNNTILRTIDSERVLTYMTQNPYTEGHIANWDKLHNSKQNRIIVGVYGSASDKDREKKINELKSLYDKMDESVIVESYTLGDAYYYVVASERKVKVLRKELTW